MSNTSNFRCKHCNQQFSQAAVYQEATVILCPLCSKMFIPSMWHYLRKEWIEPISVAIVLALFIKRIIFEIYVIPTSSMEPTLHGGGHYPEDGGDKVLVNKFVYHFTDPKNWDVIVFDPPEGNHLYIKRLIGLPGQTIQIVNGDIYANGKILRKTPEVEDALLYPIYDSSKDFNPLSHYSQFQKDPWSITENWRIAENYFEIKKASGNLIFELPIDMRIDSHLPSKLQRESGLYEKSNRIKDWNMHTDGYFSDKKVGDIQVKGKLQIKELAGNWQIVINENKDSYKLVLNIKDKKAEVYFNEDKVWDKTVSLNTDEWFKFSFSNVDDKLSGEIANEQFDYQYVNHNLGLVTNENGFQIQAKESSLEMKDIVVRRDVNYMIGDYSRFNTMEKIPGSNCENEYATFKLGEDDYLCLGDNVIDSADSRAWGFAKGSKIKGQAMYVLMPIRLWPGNDLPPQVPFFTHRTRFQKIH